MCPLAAEKGVDPLATPQSFIDGWRVLLRWAIAVPMEMPDGHRAIWHGGEH